MYDARPEAVPCAALAFPSLRRFLTLASACWPQGKILPHPSARSARHWSPQAGGPKGKMIEGRSGGSGAEKGAGLLVQQLRSVIQEIANALLKNRSLNFADVERIYGPNNYKPAPDRFID